MSEYSESYLAFSSACVHKYIYNLQQKYSSLTIYIKIHVTRSCFAFSNCHAKNINFYISIVCVWVCMCIFARKLSFHVYGVQWGGWNTHGILPAVLTQAPGSSYKHLRFWLTSVTYKPWAKRVLLGHWFQPCGVTGKAQNSSHKMAKH